LVDLLLDSRRDLGFLFRRALDLLDLFQVGADGLAWAQVPVHVVFRSSLRKRRLAFIIGRERGLVIFFFNCFSGLGIYLRAEGLLRLLHCKFFLRKEEGRLQSSADSAVSGFLNPLLLEGAHLRFEVELLAHLAQIFRKLRWRRRGWWSRLGRIHC